jgi:hypothetical protein
VTYWTAAAILGSAGATLWAWHPQPISTLAVAIASGALGGVMPPTVDGLRLPHGVAFVAVQVAAALVAAAAASCASPVTSRTTSTRS